MSSLTLTVAIPGGHCLLLGAEKFFILNEVLASSNSCKLRLPDLQLSIPNWTFNKQHQQKSCYFCMGQNITSLIDLDGLGSQGEKITKNINE